MKKLLFITAAFLMNLSYAQFDNSTIYVNDMDYVLGDVKQAFITNAITTTAEADNLIEGFKTMKVNGIRIPIYADGVNPNVTMYNYFYNKAVAEGFKIFANPAQTSGGQRIACGILNGTVCNVKNTAGTNALVNRIKAFAAQYPCDWISPFNEDGSPGDAWYAGQMNNIFSALEGQLNGAELIGPCVWGLPGGISVLQGTNIESNITVATSHNLGFHHNNWDDFIALADAANLPVWDSEVNNNDLYGTGSRLEAAIANNVDGLVIYNSWANISQSNGSVNAAGYAMMDLYLKFRTDKKYYIDCVGTNKRLAATGSSEDAYAASTSTTGANVEWKFVDKGNGYYHIQRAAGGTKPRIRTDYTSFADMQSTGSSGTQTYFQVSEGNSANSYHLTLPDISSANKRRLQITSSGDVKMVTSASTGSWVSFKFTEAGNVSKSTNSKETLSDIETEIPSKLVFPSVINASNPDFRPQTLLENRSDYNLNIFSLDGKRIFSTTDMEKAWTPSARQKGIYVFQANYVNNENVKSLERGKIVVQ